MGLKLSFALAVFLVLVSMAVMFIPEIVLRLPNGFILYAMLGHNLPPFFQYEWCQQKEFEEFTRPGDVIVSSGTKSGTNWMLYTTHLIRVKGDVDKYPFLDVNIATPWLTMLHIPGQTWTDIKQGLQTAVLKDGSKIVDHWNHKDYPFRIFKAHEVPADAPRNQDGTALPSAKLPVRANPRVKFIAIVRNPEDVLRSMHSHFGSQQPDWWRLWGGFPPVHESKDKLLNDFLDGGSLEYIWTGYIKSWWGYRNEPNVLLLSYEQILQNHEAHIRKVAKFMEVELTDVQVKKILNMTHISEMKKPEISSKFEYVRWLDPTNPTMIKPRALIRRGKSGEGASFFNQQARDRIWAQVDREIEPEQQDWMGIATRD